MPEAADRAWEHFQALGLRDALVDLHAQAAAPGPAVQDLGSRIAGAEDALCAYLADHRDVLGRTKFWHGEYAEMDEHDHRIELERPALSYPDAPELEL
jgi:hypothetical protein